MMQPPIWCPTGAHPRVRGDVGASARCASRIGAHPRVRGDVGDRGRGAVEIGAHPRVRGDVCVSSLSGQRRRGLTPACAGTSAPGLSGRCRARAHPRVRGDVLSDAGSPGLRQGSPPRARGRHERQIGQCPPGLTPACAGTSEAIEFDLLTHGAHPRVRGDVQAGPSRGVADEGSPPRARGRRRMIPTPQSITGLTPACAGTSRTWTSTRPRPRAHPRVRGDVERRHEHGDRFRGSPPRARGRPESTSARKQRDGLTPACAGTSRLRQQGAPRGAHPRVRGDVPAEPVDPRAELGSPPRARGRRRPSRVRAVRRGLTPACAGTSRSGPNR